MFCYSLFSSWPYTLMTRYSLSVLKVPINTNQPTHQEVKRSKTTQRLLFLSKRSTFNLGCCIHVRLF